MDFRDFDAPFPENFCDSMDIQPMAMGFEDLWFILSQSVHLRLLSVTAAFGAARNLQKVFGSGFEIIGIRVSQGESPCSVAGSCECYWEAVTSRKHHVYRMYEKIV